VAINSGLVCLSGHEIIKKTLEKAKAKQRTEKVHPSIKCSLTFRRGSALDHLPELSINKNKTRKPRPESRSFSLSSSSSGSLNTSNHEAHKAWRRRLLSHNQVEEGAREELFITTLLLFIALSRALPNRRFFSSSPFALFTLRRGRLRGSGSASSQIIKTIARSSVPERLAQAP
jgi:hypothetical protein